MMKALRFGGTLLLAGVLAVRPALGDEKTDAPVPASHGSGQTLAPTAAGAVQRSVEELSRWVEARGGRLGASVIDVGTGAVVAARGDRLPLNPASAMKIVTAAAALDVLGPEYVYTTGLYGDVKDGVIPELVLRGHGDPSLKAVDLYRLARSIAASGVRRVGTILVDQSRFDDAFVPPAFGQQPNEWAAFRAPVSAISLEQNTVTLNVSPEAPGKPARAWFEPGGFVDVAGTVETKPAGSGQNVILSLENASPRLRARLSGHIAAGLPRVRFRKRADDPRYYPGYVLAQLLRDAGVTVEGSVGLGGASVRKLLTYVESAPLGVLIRELGKESDNFYAETILKTLGAETKGPPAKSADGAAAVLTFLRSAGAEDPGTVVLNGSGLFDANRVTAHTLTAVLHHAYRSPKLGPEFMSQLAIGGVDGTLRSRFRDPKVRHRVRAKTGTLNNVIALAGYVLDDDGGSPVAFAFLAEGLEGKQAELRQKIDACVEAIVVAQ